MDQVEFGGRTYVSSKRASEITGYAKDYVGQLARTKRVPATRIGRAWYVDSNAIKKHAGLSDGNLTEVEIPAEQVEEKRDSAPRDKEFIQILPQASDKTPYSLYELKNKGIKKDLLKTWSNVNYSHDDRPLFPQNDFALQSEEEHNVPLKIEISASTDLNAPRQEKYTMSIPTHNPVLGRRLEEKRKNDLKIKTDRNTRLLLSKPSKSFLLQAGYIAVSLFVVFGIGSLGGVYVPSEWVFENANFVGASVGAEAGVNTLLEYFRLIFDDGLVLIADFFAFLFGSLADFFDLGLIFILDLFNLG